MNPNDVNMMDAPTGLDDAGSDVTMPLGTGFEAEAGLNDFSTGSGGKKLNASSLVLVGVVLLGAGGLFVMKTLATASAGIVSNSAVEQVIERFVNPEAADLDGLLNAESEGVLQVLNASYTEEQIPLIDVARDPFVIYQEFVDTPVTTATDPATLKRAQWEKNRAMKRMEFESAASGMEVKSVLMGAQPLANVSGKIVRQGQTLNAGTVVYEVSEINATSVTLLASDSALELEVEVVLQIKRN